jgi:hypothetical protein
LRETGETTLVMSRTAGANEAFGAAVRAAVVIWEATSPKMAKT